MSSHGNPNLCYNQKLAAATPEEAAHMEDNRRARLSAGMKRSHAIKRIVNTVLKSGINPSSYEKDILNVFGYDINECGVPTVAVMVILSMAAKAAKGDVRAAEFLFSYGGIPNMDQQIKREHLDYLRHRDDPKEMDIEDLSQLKILLDVPSVIN